MKNHPCGPYSHNQITRHQTRNTQIFLEIGYILLNDNKEQKKAYKTVKSSFPLLKNSYELHF